MAIEFRRAPTIAAGESLTSAQHNGLARAFNSRITSPFDVAWRIAWYLDSATKQVSAPSSDPNLTPARDEFTKIFGHYLQSNHRTWPDPGVPNVAASPLMKMVYGDDNSVIGRVGIGSEDTRTDLVASGLPPATATPEQLWVLAKIQRGFADLAAGKYAAPAVTAAQEVFKITPNFRAKFLISFGGFIPTPLPVPNLLCGDVEETEVYDIFFTSLMEGVADKHYTGFCPDGSDGSKPANAIKGIYSGPFSWHVYFHAVRAPEVLSRAEWLLGPFTGPGRLSHGPSDFIGQACNRYLSTFRGSLADRATSRYDAKRFGFDFQTFLTSQYLLAPSKGALVGELVRETTVNHTASGPSIAAGLLFIDAITAGFVFGGLFVRATGLLSQASVTLLVGGVTTSVTVTPGSPVAYAYSSAGLTGAFKLSNATAATTEAGGSLYIEVLELQVYKPGIHDAYLLLRLGSAPSAMLDSGQEDGDAYASPKSISSGYFQHGMIYNTGSTGLSLIPDTNAAASAFIESARRMAIDNLRLVSGVKDMNQVVKYAVEGGKSVLWFNRFALGNAAADIFRELAPMRRESGSIQAGVVYDVQDYGIQYNGELVTAGSSFTGVFGVTTFTTPTGPGWVRERDGIKRTALKKGWSNEWVLVPTWQHGPINQDSESATWKEDAAAAHFALNNPCLVYSRSLTENRGYRTHYNYGLKPILKAEAPSGHNYPGGLGVTTGDIAFSMQPSDALPLHFASCQIYQQPYEVESCVMEGPLVKMTFTTRWRRHASTPSGDIGSLPDNWDSGLLAREDYQTDEGRIRKFLLLRAGIGAVPGATFGDAAYDGLAAFQRLEKACAAVIPKFYLVRQIPLAYEDCNATTDPEDSPVTVESMLQMELYARPMCEAFVDQSTSVGSNCNLGGIAGARLYDFTPESAMFQATGRSWFQTLPSAVVGSNTKGYGPLQRTQFYASIFNQFSAFVNLLTRVRIDLPLILQTRARSATEWTAVTTFDQDGALPAFDGVHDLTAVTPSKWALWEGKADPVSLPEWTENWTEALPNTFGQIAFQGVKTSGLSADYWKVNGANYSWASVGYELQVQWRVDPKSEALGAMSDDVRALVSNHAGLLVQTTQEIAQVDGWGGTLIPLDGCPRGLGGSFPRPNTFQGGATSTSPQYPSCELILSGSPIAPDLRSSKSAVATAPNGTACVYGGSSNTRTQTIAGTVDQQGRITVGQGNVFIQIPVVDFDPCAT